MKATAGHRGAALRRIGCSVTFADPTSALRIAQLNGMTGRFHYLTGYRFLQWTFQRWLRNIVTSAPTPDLVWVDSGEFFGAKSVALLRRLGAPIVLYNLDDPTGDRDGHRFDMLRQALPVYDLCVTVRKETELEMRQRGARQALRFWRGYDEIAHAPFIERSEIPEDLRSEVAFVGTWMRHEKRDLFIRDLLRLKVPVSIWGNRWQKSPYWNEISKSWRGNGLLGREYAAAIRGAKICLGMLSKGNRDLHTHRSAEIPFAGGVLCAERTSEHLELYRENEEAVFWSSAEECAIKCLALLADDVELERIRVSGMRRVRELHIGNEDLCRQVIGVQYPK